MSQGTKSYVFYLFVNVIVHITQAVGGNPAPPEHRASKTITLVRMAIFELHFTEQNKKTHDDVVVAELISLQFFVLWHLILTLQRIEWNAVI